MSKDDAWLQPISTDEPCGPNIEYDAEYVVLASNLMPQVDVQYGKFIEKPTLPDWGEIERQCRRLLLRSKDICVLLWLARCRTRVAGVAGMLEALELLWAVLERYPDAVHPQLVLEDAYDPVVRANAITGLVDPDGFLGDVREAVVSPASALRLTIRDIERALAVPRGDDALQPDAVRLQLAAMRAQGDPGLAQLAECHDLVLKIQGWSSDTLGDLAPDLGALLRLLAVFRPGADLPREQAAGSTPTEAHVSGFSAAPSTVDMHTEREQVRVAIRQIRQWLEHHEPSSPVAVLLKQAERLLGKRYAEVAQSIPLDLLAKWDQED